MICPGCTQRLISQLLDVAEILDQLDITLVRLDATTSRGIARPSAEKPLPWKERASQAKRNLLAATYDALTCFRTAEISKRDESRIARHDESPRLAIRLNEAVKGAWQAMDQPAEYWFVGPCGPECEYDLYALAGADKATCRACGAVHDVQQRREWLLERAWNQLVTAQEVSRGLSGLLREPVSLERLRQWVKRGLVLRHGQDHEGNWLYCVGDIVEALTRTTGPRATHKKAS